MNSQQLHSNAFLPLLLTLSLCACDEPETEPSPDVGLGGAHHMAGANAGGMAGDSTTGSGARAGGSGGAKSTGGSHSGEGGLGGAAGSGGSGVEEVADVILPAATYLNGQLNHRLELAVDGKTISDGLTWELAEGELPEGVTLSTDGWLAGRPTQAGVFKFRLRVTGPDLVATSDVEWEIEEIRWLAYVGSTETETNLFLLDTALTEPSPIPVFSEEHGVQGILESEFSPGSRRYLSVLAQTESGTQAYIVDTYGTNGPIVSAMSYPNSSAIFWSRSANNHGYTRNGGGSSTEVFVNDAFFGSFTDLVGIEFLDDDHLIVATYKNAVLTVESVFRFGSKTGSGSVWSPVGPPELVGHMSGAARYLFRFPAQSGMDYFWINASGQASYVTSAAYDGDILWSPDNAWAARTFPAGTELKNYVVAGRTLSLSEFPEFPTFSPDSRWFVGIRDVHFVRELTLVDLEAEQLGELILPGWSKFYGFCSNWVGAPSRFAAGMTEDGKLRFLDFGWDGDQAPPAPEASDPGAITSVDSFTCTRDGAALTITGTAAPSRRTAQLYDASAPTAAPRDLLTGMPAATLSGAVQLSLDGKKVAFKVTEEGTDSLLYTTATRAPSNNESADCGNDTPCKSIGWFQFQL